MTRRTVSLLVALLMAGGFATGASAAKEGDCGGGRPACECSCEKTDDGVRCTILARGDTSVAEVRERVRGCVDSCGAAEGVTIAFEDVDGGIAVIFSAEDPRVVEGLHERSDGCGAGKRFCFAAAGAFEAGAWCPKSGKGCCKARTTL